MSEADKGYRGGGQRQFEVPPDRLNWRSPYDFDSEEIQILISKNQSPVWSQVFDLSTAQTPQQPLIINQPGRAFRITGLTTATKYSLATNSGLEAVVSNIFLGAFLLNQNGNNQGLGDPSEAIYLKHGGGFRGDFLGLGFFWPAQNNNAVRITVYRFDGVPWATGDAST